MVYAEFTEILGEMTTGVGWVRNVDWNKVTAWMRGHPARTIRWFFALVVECSLAGVFGYALAFGPFNQSMGPVSLSVGILFGVMMLVTALAERIFFMAGDFRRSDFLKFALRRLVIWVIVAVGFTAAVQLYLTGFLPPITPNKEAAFNRLCAAIGRTYPYFDLKGINWGSVYPAFESRLGGVSLNGDYFLLLQQMLGALRDGHAGVVTPNAGGALRWMGEVEEVQGQAVVRSLREGVNIAGLTPGAVILNRDGIPIDQYINSLPPALRSGSTLLQSRAIAYSMLLAIRPGEESQITFLGTDNQFYTATLKWTDDYALQTSPGPAITYERLPGGIGLIRLSTFSGDLKLLSDFDRAVNELMDSKGLVIDIRGNSGGYSLYASLMAGRFFDAPFIYGTEYYRARIPQHLWASRLTYQVMPRMPIYQGPIAVLTNARTVSSSEMFAVAMQDSGRGVVIGRPTGGSSGSPVYFRMPDGVVSFSTGDFVRNDGTRIEGRGVRPDIMVEYTRGDLIRGEDPDVAQAVDFLSDFEPRDPGRLPSK